MLSKNSLKVSFVTSGTKKVEDVLFLPMSAETALNKKWSFLYYCLILSVYQKSTVNQKADLGNGQNLFMFGRYDKCDTPLLCQTQAWHVTVTQNQSVTVLILTMPLFVSSLHHDMSWLMLMLRLLLSLTKPAPAVPAVTAYLTRDSLSDPLQLI